MRNYQKSALDVLLIGGHYSSDKLSDSTVTRHVDDFRLKSDGVLMTMHNLKEYFSNNYSFNDVKKRQLNTEIKPYKQISYSSLHIFSLLKKSGFEVGLLNTHDVNDDKRLKLYNECPSFVVVSTTFTNLNDIQHIISDVREHLPNAILIIGGSFVHHSWRVYKKQDEPNYCETEVLGKYLFTSNNKIIREADYYIFDEHGEETLVLLLNSLKTKQDINKIPNIAYYENDTLIFHSEIIEGFTMDKFPVMWKSIPREYLSTVIPMSLTYGCSFKCRFCNFSGCRITKKSFDTIFTELKEIAELELVQTVWFTDDNFLLSPQQIEKFCSRYISERIPMDWISFIRAKSITENNIELVKKSRAKMLLLGLESGSQTILNSMNKNVSISDYKKALSIIFDAGVDTEINFIIGYPGENKETISETIDFINTLPFNNFQIPYLYLFKFNLVPLSPVFVEPLRTKYKLTGNFLNWKHITLNSEALDEILTSIAVIPNGTVFNYLDGDIKAEKTELLDVMRTRETVGRAILRNENQKIINQYWALLQKKISALFRLKL